MDGSCAWTVATHRDWLHRVKEIRAQADCLVCKFLQMYERFDSLEHAESCRICEIGESSVETRAILGALKGDMLEDGVVNELDLKLADREPSEHASHFEKSKTTGKRLSNNLLTSDVFCYL